VESHTDMTYSLLYFRYDSYMYFIFHVNIFEPFKIQLDIHDIELSSKFAITTSQTESCMNKLGD